MRTIMPRAGGGSTDACQASWPYRGGEADRPALSEDATEHPPDVMLRPTLADDLELEPFDRLGHGNASGHTVVQGVRCHHLEAGDGPPLVRLHGRLDRVVSWRKARCAHARLPRSRLVVVPRCGHRVPHEAPDTLKDTLHEFTARHA